MNKKAFIWVMVTLLGVTMTTACEDYESPKDKIANISELINKDIKDIVQQNEEVSDTIRKKDSTTVFLDEFENVLDEYKDKNTLRSEEVEAIQNLVRLASAEFEQTLSKHPELRDNSTLNEYLDSLKQKEDDLTSYLNDIKKLEEIDSDSEDVAFFSWMTTVSFLVLVAILIATIAHFRAKLKKVSQKQADIGSGKEKTKGKHAPTYNTEVQKNNPFQQLSQLVTEEAKNIRREIDKSKNDLSRQLSQLSQSQFTTVNSGYVPSGGTNGSQLNGGNAVQPLPNVPTDGSRLYAELDASSNGGFLYKAQPIRTSNSLYEITLKQPGATEGSFRVLEDCSTMSNVLRNRNQYLTACDFNGNDNATKIVNEAPGAVSKQQNGLWLVTKKAKIKLC